MALVSDKATDGTKISDLPPSSEKKVEVCCDGCGKQSFAIWANYRRSQEHRGNPGTTYCRGCASKISGKAKVGKPAWNRGRKLPPHQRGQGHPSWKGGRYIDAHGYVAVHHPGEHDNPRSKWENYVKEHVLVMEQHVGRRLEQGEVVHHIDGDRQNNKLSNLYLTNFKGHRNAHQSLQEIGYSLVKGGLVSFDVKNGQYVAQHKLRELLGQLVEADQQPSLSGDTEEGSETRRVSLKETIIRP